MVLGVALYLSTPTLLRFSGEFLLKSVPISNPDLILVLSGDSDGSRTQLASTVYKNNLNCKILFTGGHYYGFSIPQLMKKNAISLGVLSADIILEENSTSSYENALYTKSIISEMDLNSVLIVTSKYHTKRAYLTFTHVFEQSSIKFGISGAEDGVNYSNWWIHNKNSEIVLTELAKLIWYKLTVL